MAENLACEQGRIEMWIRGAENVVVDASGFDDTDWCYWAEMSGSINGGSAHGRYMVTEMLTVDPRGTV